MATFRLELRMTVRYTRAQVADIIEQFLEGTGDRWAWDDFTSIKIVDPDLDAIRRRCSELYDGTGHQYCGPEGFNEMRLMVEGLRR